MTIHQMHIMCKEGDTTITWQPDNPDSVRDARREFNALVRQGYQAFRMNIVSENGVVVEEKGERIDSFDPEAGRVMMVPHLRGG